MTREYFSTLERIAALDAEARTWLETPFAPHARVKGAGADCVQLVAGIYLACGVLKEFNPGDYALVQGEKIRKWFAGRNDFAAVEIDRIQPGDFLNLDFVRFQHAALVVTEGIIHVLPQRKVILSDRRESFYTRRITAAYRPLEVTP